LFHVDFQFQEAGESDSGTIQMLASLAILDLSIDQVKQEFTAFLRNILGFSGKTYENTIQRRQKKATPMCRLFD
jgi:hypothetical protein